MDEHFYLYNEEKQKVEKVTAEKYAQKHAANLAKAKTDADRRLATMDYFTGMRSRTKSILPQQLEMEEKAGESFKEMLTDAERTRQKETSGTEIYAKHQNAARIAEAQKNLTMYRDERCTSVAKDLHISKEDLRAIGSFFGSIKQENLRLAESWMSRNEDPKNMLQAFLEAFITNTADQWDLSSESKLAENAGMMEMISAQYDTMLNILADYRETYDKLPEQYRRMVNRKLGEANGIVNYYRLMRTVITDPYYMTHENRELTMKGSDHDTPRQKRLRSQLWLAKGGLKSLTEYGVKTLDDKLDALCGNLSTTVVMGEELKEQLKVGRNVQLRVQKELRERWEEIEKNGLSGRLRNMSAKGQLRGMDDNGSNKSLFFRARYSMKKLELPERVEGAVNSISAILDQLDFLEAFAKEKVQSSNYYLLEHNYRDIAVMEKVESLSGPLKEMKEAVLAILSVNDQGVMCADMTLVAAFKSAQTKYRAALKAYRNGMSEAGTLNTFFMLPPQQEGMTELLASADKARITLKNSGEEANEKKKNATREKIRSLMLKLAANGYSDADIYKNAKEIMNLMVDKQRVFGNDNKAEFPLFNHICFLAEYLYAKKRRSDIAEAKKQKLSKKLRNALEAEDEELKAYVFAKKGKEYEEGKAHFSLQTAQDAQQQLRLQAEKDSYDLADLKATAAHYMFQEEWARNSRRAEMSFGRRVGKGFFSGLTRFLGWVFSKPKTTCHGRELYEESKEKLTQLPREIETFGNKDAGHTIHHGDGSYAPPVELNKYFKDPMKITLAKDYNDIRALMGNKTGYPQYVTDAEEALFSYCKVRGIVNRDTFEMEQAFLDKFRVSMNAMLSDGCKFIDKNPALSQKLLKTYKDMLSLSNGNLKNKMTKAEYEAAKEQKAIYVRDTYTGDMKESNMRDLPLFPHEPNLNDVKQGTLGDCYLLGATQTILAESPGIIRDMFTDLGNGEVLVRFYAPFGEVKNPDGSIEYRRVDDPEQMGNLGMRSVYVKVKKQYTTGEAHSSDCMWVQLLEVAYAAAGFNHGEAEVKEDGELINLNAELTDGDPQVALMHLTGRKYRTESISKLAVHTMEQSAIDRSDSAKLLQKHILLAGVEPYLWDPIYSSLCSLKEAAIESGESIDEEWKIKTIKEAVSSGLQVARTKNTENTNWKNDLTELVQQGKLTKEEKEDLEKKIKERYFPKGEEKQKQVNRYTDQILRNMKNPGNGNISLLKGYLSLTELAGKIHDELTKEQKPPEAGQKPIEAEKKPIEVEKKPIEAGQKAPEAGQKPAEVKEPTAYERILGRFNNKVPKYRDKQSNLPQGNERSAIKFSVTNFMTLNPENRYTQRELGVLTLLRRQMAKRKGKGEGNAVCFADKGHVRTVLDTKFYNGKWFVLVRDPFNVYRNEYSTQENGIKTESYSSVPTVLTEHFPVRSLSTDLKMGFLGTCWYELKDIAKDVLTVQLQEDDRGKGFADSFDDQ